MKPDEPVKVVTIGVDELRALLRDVAYEVAEELAEGRTEAPTLVDRSNLARHLGISTSTVKRLMDEGLPWYRVGDVARFRVAEVVEWLKNRPKPVE